MAAKFPRHQLDAILPLVYEELRGCASHALASERADHTFQTTELVHEAYVRLTNLREIDWDDNRDVLRAAVGIMRRVLIDHARARNAQKRNSGKILLSCSEDRIPDKDNDTQPIDLLALDLVLKKLQDYDARKSEIVELRYFGGQTIEEIADLLQISAATVKREWAFTKAWLGRELDGEMHSG